MSKSRLPFFVSLISAVFLCTSVTAEPAASSDEVVAMLETFMQDYYQALNDGDALGAESCWSGQVPTSEYPRHGGLLESFPARPLEETAAYLKQAFENGLDLDVTVHNLHVELYGDSAVATLYSSGTVTHPGRGTTGGTARVSYFLIHRDDGWKIVHMHSSPVRIADP